MSVESIISHGPTQWPGRRRCHILVRERFPDLGRFFFWLGTAHPGEMRIPKYLSVFGQSCLMLEKFRLPPIANVIQVYNQTLSYIVQFVKCIIGNVGRWLVANEDMRDRVAKLSFSFH